MKEGAMALSKVRAYSYLIFVFELLLLFHKNIADLFGTTDRKILYGLVLLMFFQVTICIMYAVKYVTTVNPKDKKKKEIIMYASRVRVYLTAMYLELGVMVLNDIWMKNFFLDKAMVIFLLLMLILVLQNLTILQRRQY